MTNGSICIGDSGTQFTQFHVRDGYAIKELLPELEIVPIVISERKSKMIEEWCHDFGISVILQDVEDKYESMMSVLNEMGISKEATAYVGDDLNDLECMKHVGLKACPNDAVDEIKNIADYVSSKDAGHGALRDFIDWIRRNKKQIDL